MSSNVDATSRSALVRLPQQEDQHAVLGTRVTYKLRSKESGGAAIVELSLPPGIGVPRHTHRDEDETFLVLDGAVQFELEGRAGPVAVPAGGVVHGPRDQAHGFRNAGPGSARMLVVLSPGRGVEQMFAELDALPANPDLAAVSAICARYRITFG